MNDKWSVVRNIIGASCAAMILIVGSVLVVHPAISELAGLAVAQTATQWNNVRDAAVGDNLTNGIFASGLYLFNGTTFDRARGDTTNGLDVDVTRLPDGAQSPADGYTNPTTFNGVWSLSGLFNGTTWDRWRSASATNNTATTSLGASYMTPLSTWSVTHTPATNTQATASRAAGGGTVRHVATSVTACFATDTAVGAGPFNANLRDGATGAGTVLRTWIFNFPVAEQGGCVDLSGLNMTGSANTAMTLEFTAAGGANTVESVTLTGYSTP